MTIIRIDLAGSHVEAIRALADELETVDGAHPAFQRVPLWSDVLINSGGETGWIVSVCWGPVLMGEPDDLRRLCASLVGVGRKREREIAGRIKVRAARFVDSSAWTGTPPERKPNTPKSIKDIAEAWKSGKPLSSGNVRTDGRRIYSWNLCIGKTVRGRKVAIDYRQRVSRSTSQHCGAAISVADRVQKPT